MSFCIALEANIDTDRCPLAKGKCYWQHRETHECRYTEADLTPAEFCTHVGLPMPTPEASDKFKTDLRALL